MIDHSPPDRRPMKIVNLTPHPVAIVLADGHTLTFATDGPAARVGIERGDAGSILVDGRHVPIGWTQLGSDLSGLPEFREGTIVIVSRVVAEAAAHRTDLVFPDDLIRSDDGVVIGCRRLCRLGRASDTTGPDIT